MYSRFLSDLSRFDTLDEARARLRSVTIGSDKSVTLEIQICWKEGDEEITTWILNCSDIRRVSISEISSGGVQYSSEDHPLSREWLDPIAELVLVGRADEGPDALLGRLLRRHLEVADDWIEFDRYLVEAEKLLQRLEQGRGTIGQGPRFLVEAYAEAIREAGGQANVMYHLGPQGGGGPMHIIHVGTSFVVCGHIAARLA